jgi:hypothetical protein
MTRFSKVFQLLTVALVITVVNVYVIGAPLKTGTNLKKDTATTVTKDVAPVTVTTAVGAEKLALAPGAKINFNRLFSKNEIKSRAMTSHSFLNARTSGRDLFKAPARTGAAPDDTDTKDDDGSKSTWIAVGIIAAVVTIAVIGLRHDRSSTGNQ